MNKLTAWFRWLLAEEPAIAAWISGGGLAVLLAYLPGLHVTHAEEAAAATIFAGLATLWTAYRTRHGTVALLTGALVTIAGGLAAFGYHASPHLIALAAAVLAVVMALGHRVNLSPLPRVPVLPAPPLPPRPGVVLPGAATP